MNLPPTSSLMAEYVVTGSILFVTGATIRWFAKAVLEIREWVREHGHGLVDMVKTNQTHIASLRTDVDHLTDRVKRVENTCLIVHGEVIVRGDT